MLSQLLLSLYFKATNSLWVMQMQIANNTVNFLEFETLASLKFERTRERINEHEQSEIVPGEMREFTLTLALTKYW